MKVCLCLFVLTQGSTKMQLGMQVVQQDPNMEGEGWNEVSNEAKDVVRYAHMLNRLQASGVFACLSLTLRHRTCVQVTYRAHLLFAAFNSVLLPQPDAHKGP